MVVGAAAYVASVRGKEWTMRRKEKEEDAKLRERRGRMATGSLVLGVVGRNLLVERGGGNHDCNHSSSNGEGGSTDKKLADCPMCGQKETRGIIETMPRRGEENLRETLQEFGSWGHAGETKLAFEIFLLSRIFIQC
jgi:hypothetical protein